MYAQVILNIAHSEVDKIFDYKIPFELLNQISVGFRVNVPFGFKNKKTEGYVIGIVDSSLVDESKIKYIIEVLDKFPVFSKEMIDLGIWMKSKYYTTLSQCLQTIMPSGINMVNEEKKLFVNKSGEELEEIKNKMKLQEMSLKQLLVIEYLEKFGATTSSKITKDLKISSSPIKTLLKNNVIAIEAVLKRKNLELDNVEKTKPLAFTNEQKNAYDAIFIEDSKNVLIHGVTGSGKTEIYLQAIEKVISEGKEAIVLVPEISLTPQLSNRFISRFGEKVAVTHSRMSQGERHEVWQRARNQEVSIVIGPRSAIFAPFENLGIIIIDEEHEGTYKSETSPKYDAREVAEVRGETNNCKVIYGSATPSLKTYYKGQNGLLNVVTLKERPLSRSMPRIEIADMRKEFQDGNLTIFSKNLYYSMKETLEKKEQIILFINRRGFSTFVSCRKCGEVIMCDRCNVSYTYHSKDEMLRCHYCGGQKEIPKTCPKCSSKYIKFFGTGTQKVENEVKKYFPNAKVLRMDMDTTSKKNSHKEILEAFRNKEADILIGTQMIAKGHDFPNVTLVGIIAADTSLNINNFQSSETTFQLITQVAGRAGRDNLAGKVIIQTYSPENKVIELSAIGDYEEFYNYEIKFRKLMNYPPFSNLFSILLMGKKEEDVISQINMLSDILKKNNVDNLFTILGPSPAVISKIKDEYRWRIFVKGEDEEKLKDFVNFNIDEFKPYCKKGSILINISLNPQSIV